MYWVWAVGLLQVAGIIDFIHLESKLWHFNSDFNSVVHEYSLNLIRV